MLVPINLPSSEPLPLVLAVAMILKPGAGLTNLLIFFKKIDPPSSIGCKHIILLDAKSTSSRRRIAPLSIAITTGPSSHTVSPFFKVK